MRVFYALFEVFPFHLPFSRFLPCITRLTTYGKRFQSIHPTLKRFRLLSSIPPLFRATGTSALFATENNRHDIVTDSGPNPHYLPAVQINTNFDLHHKRTDTKIMSALFLLLYKALNSTFSCISAAHPYCADTFPPGKPPGHLQDFHSIGAGTTVPC